MGPDLPRRTLPLTSNNVELLVNERAARLAVPGSSASLLSSLRRIETPDDITIRFVLSRPDTQFGWALASPAASIVDEEVYNADELSPPEGPIVSSGPYTGSRLRAATQLELLRALEKYRGHDPTRTGHVRYAWAPDSATLGGGHGGPARSRWSGVASTRPRSPGSRGQAQRRTLPSSTTEDGFSVITRYSGLPGSGQLVWAPGVGAAQRCAPVGDRHRPAGRPDLRLGRAGRRPRTHLRVRRRRPGRAEGDLEEPHPVDSRLRPDRAGRPRRRDPDPHPTGGHRAD